MQYIKYNANPKEKITTDCVVRAISTAMHESWMQTYEKLCELGKKKCKMPNDSYVFAQYLRNNGFEQMTQKKHSSGSKYTIKELVDSYIEENVILVIKCRGHLTCAIYDTLIDTWNCGWQKAGQYWLLRPENFNKIDTDETETFLYLNYIEGLAEEQKPRRRRLL